MGIVESQETKRQSESSIEIVAHTIFLRDLTNWMWQENRGLEKSESRFKETS
jgi:hypothetical protein